MSNTRATAVTIETSSGRLQGCREGDVASFKGIPYAAPPVGALRWRPPQPAQPWPGMLDATAFRDDCMQADIPRLRGSGRSEDCLYLNIWTPADRNGDAVPVMVWVPGGGFVGGSGSDRRANGAKFAAMGVVLITLNYRVGMFGYLAHPGLTAESEHGASGNYGLMDIAVALEWVRDNINAFGGDPGRVTAFGVSAGSASIGLLLTSPRIEGLFHRTILQSPGIWRPLTKLDEAEAAGNSLNSDIRVLRAMDAETLFSHTAALNPSQRSLTRPRTLRPINDGWLLTEDDRDSWKRGAFEAMPMIVGSNAEEGSLFTGTWPVRTPSDFSALLEASFGDMAGEAAAVYPAADEAAVAEQLAFLFGDTQFTLGTWGIGQVAAALGQPVWRHLLTRHPGGRAWPPKHGEDVAYTFGNLHTADPQEGEIGALDEAVSDTIMRSWVQFAHGEAPSGPGIDWPQVTSDTSPYLALGDAITVEDGWRQSQIRFLDRYFDAKKR
jgi:para-nitrobenzyl esterase